MKKTKKGIWITLMWVVSVIAIVFGLFYYLVVYGIYRDATLTFVVSTPRQLKYYCQNNAQQVAIEAVKADWQLLCDEDCNLLGNRLMPCMLDKGPMKPLQETCLFDIWGNRVNIAVRKDSKNELKFLVWSKGPDGIDGTNDDVFPKPYYSKQEIPYNAGTICLFKKEELP